MPFDKILNLITTRSSIVFILLCLTLGWKTEQVASNNSSNITSSQVDLYDGIFVDSAHTDIRVNLRDIFLSSTEPFEDNNDSNSSFRYFVQFTGENGRCSPGVKICQLNVDSNQTVDLGSYIEYSSLDVYSQQLEVSLKSNTSCKSIIRFYCEPLANSSSGFRFESQSDECVYRFDWPLRRFCHLNDSIRNVQPVNSTQSLFPMYESSSEIPSIVLVFAFMCTLVLLLVMFNNHQYIANMRIWTWIGLKSQRVPKLSALRNRRGRADKGQQEVQDLISS